jgi:peptidyl-prolyl cis-trans isomerase SurA
VNDNAISVYQIEQRMKLLRALGDEGNKSKAALKKFALQDLIDEVLKREEAKRLKADLSEDKINETIKNSPGLQGMTARLRKLGMSPRLVKRFISTRMTWNRLVSGKYGDVSVNDSQIDAKHKQIVDQINREIQSASVTVFKLMPIDLPVDRQPTKELTQEVARSRMIEAQRLVQRFKGCGSARDAASGIFNVQVGKVMEADPRQMPKQTIASLKKLGAGKAAVMGVSSDLSKVQIIAFCGTKRMTPQAPKITREDVKGRLENDRYRTLGKSYIRELRKNAFIEYKDSALQN